MTDSGPDEGEVITFSVAQGASGRHYEEGDGILVTKSLEAPEGLQYNLYEYQRSNPMLFLAVLFAVRVVLLSRWRGFMALVGLAISLVVLIQFVLTTWAKPRTVCGARRPCAARSGTRRRRHR